MSETAPTFDLDPIIHAPHRLRICAMLSGAKEVEFATLTTELNLSPSALSKHVAQLVDAGYVQQKRALKNSRHRQWLSLTHEGDVAYRRHILALRAIVGE